MRNPIEFFRDFGLGTAETFANYFMGREESRENFTDRSQFRVRMYQAQTELWRDIEDLLYGSEKGATEVRLEEVFAKFRREAAKIYKDFNAGVDYSEAGAIERSWDSMSMRFHRMLLSSSTREKDLQYAFEQCWNHFFALIKVKKERHKTDAKTVSKDSITSRTADFFLPPMQEMNQVELLPGEKVDYHIDQLLTREGAEYLSNGEKSRVARRVADRITPGLALRIAESLKDKLTGKQMLELYPAMELLIRYLLLIQSKIFTTVAFEHFGHMATFGLMTSIEDFLEERGFGGIDDWEEERKAWTKKILDGNPEPEFEAAFIEGMEAQPVYARHLIERLTGIWVYNAASKDAIRAAARKYVFHLRGVLFSEQETRAFMRKDSDELLIRTADDLAPSVALGISIQVESVLRTTVQRHLRGKMEVPFLSHIDFLDEHFSSSVLMEIAQTNDMASLRAVTGYLQATCKQIGELGTTSRSGRGGMRDVLYLTRAIAAIIWDTRRAKSEGVAFTLEDINGKYPRTGIYGSMRRMPVASVQDPVKRLDWIVKMSEWDAELTTTIADTLLEQVGRLITDSLSETYRLEGLARLGLVDSSFISTQQDLLYDYDPKSKTPRTLHEIEGQDENMLELEKFMHLAEMNGDAISVDALYQFCRALLLFPIGEYLREWHNECVDKLIAALEESILWPENMTDQVRLDVLLSIISVLRNTMAEEIFNQAGENEYLGVKINVRQLADALDGQGLRMKKGSSTWKTFDFDAYYDYMRALFFMTGFYQITGINAIREGEMENRLRFHTSVAMTANEWLQTTAKTETTNILREVHPNFLPDGEFDPDLEYDLDTFPGVMRAFYTNISDAINAPS